MTPIAHTARFLPYILTVVLLTALAPPIAPAEQKADPRPGTAVGTLSVNGQRVRLNHAYALAQPNTFAKDKTDIAVLLTEKPLADDALNDIEEMDVALHGVPAYAHFEIDETGKPIREGVNHPALPGSNLQMSGFTHAAFTPKVFAKGSDRIAGRFSTGGVVPFVGQKYSLEVEFAAMVVKAKIPEPLPDAKTGKALPANGGEPGKAFLALHQAILKKDVDAVLRLNAAPMPPKEKLAAGLDFLAEMQPRDPRITKGYINQAGDRAALYVTGVSDGQKQYGTIEAIKKDGTWRLLKQSWSDKPPK